MDDPFFAEDDGEFDDFYGNGASKRPSQAAMPRPSEPVRSAPSMAYPDTPASSVASFQSRSTDGALLSVSTVTPSHGVAATRSERDDARQSTRRKKPRRRRSQERFEVEWEKDDDVSACFVCANAFSLLKRKHHCRHCGRVICSDCSSFRRFSSSRGKHRVCSYCSVEIANGGGRHTLGGQDERESVSDVDMAMSQRQDHARRDGSALRQSDVGAFSSKSARSRPEDAPSRKSFTHLTTNREHPSELFDTSDDMWFGDPVDDDTDRRAARTKTSRTSQQPAQTVTNHRESYVRPQVVSAPDSLFDVQFTNGNQFEAESDDDERDDFAMPRPTSEIEAARGVKPRPSDFHMSSRRSTAVRLDAPLTMDDLQSSSASASYVSSASAYETALVAAPPIKSSGADQTFYNDDVDHLVVDDAPGYYDSVMHEQTNVPNVTPGYSNPTLMPRPSAVAPMSDDSSGTLVEVSDVSNVAAQVSTVKNDDQTRGEKGFTGALKRFFGISKNKREVPPSHTPSTKAASPDVTSASIATVSRSQPEQPRVASPREHQIPAEMPRPTVVAPTTFDHYDEDEPPQSDPGMDVYDTRRNDASEDNFKSESLYASSEVPLRHTMAGYVMPSSRADSLMRASVVGTIGTASTEPVHHQVTRKKSRNSVRSRRDTFDNLFDAPPASLASMTTAAAPSRRPVQSWTSPYDGRSTVGVDRFDRPRSEDLDDDITRGLGLPGDQDRSVVTQPASSSRTPWSGVSSYRSSGDRPMYATPYTSAPNREPAHQEPYDTQFQPPRGETSEYDRSDICESGRENEPKRTIMDDLRPKSTAPLVQTASRKDSVDDYFAEFERPTEYVFDSASGTYISATPVRSKRSSMDRTGNMNESSSTVLKTMELRDERLQASTRTTDVLEPVREDMSDEIDGVIADKISTLASELEALKQLLRQRRVRGSPASIGRASTASRKQSIFESDGSDDDASARPIKPAKSKRTPSSKTPKEVAVTATQKNRQGRKDSFADLFEDDAEEDSLNKQGFGTRNYEALFQIGQAPTKAVENSDDDGQEKKLSGRARKRESKAKKQRDDEYSSGTENEPRQSVAESAPSRFSRANRSESFTQSLDDEDESARQTVTAIVAVPTAETKKKAKKDAIDSLFDSDSDQDMGQLYEATPTPQIPISRRHSKRSEASTFDQADENDLITPYKSALTNDVQREDHAEALTSIIPEALDSAQAASLDEEFSSALKNLRGRRKTSPESVTAPVPTPSSDLSDPDDNSSFLARPSVTDQPSDRLQLSETAHSGDEDAEEIPSTPDHGGTRASVFSPVDVDAFDRHYVSRSDRVLTGIEADADINILEANGQSAQQESAHAVTDADLLDSTSPADTMSFDPLALLDDDTSTGRTIGSVATTQPEIESSPWGQDVGAIGERLKALRFRDSLLDDPSTDDVFGTSTSLNLDDLFNGRSEDPGHTSDSDEEQQLPSSESLESFSFEVKQKKRPRMPEVVPQVPEESNHVLSRDTEASTLDGADDIEPTQSEPHVHTTIANGGDEETSVLSSVAEETNWGSMSIASSSGDPDLATDTIESAQFQDDWQRLQEQEKERKKKLQLKQRQAQREKLKKQSSSGRSLGKAGSTRGFVPSATSPTASGSSKSSRTDRDPLEASERKKKKKHRKKAEDEIEGDDDESQLARKSEKRRHKRHAAPSGDTPEDQVEPGLAEPGDLPRSSGRTEL